MSIPSHQLDAFLAVVRTGSFTRAAEGLHVTQPALSHRIRELETRLATRVLIRRTTGVELTETGRRLFRYCQTREGLEQEVLAEILPARGESGFVTVAAFSSVARSCVLPALAPAIRSRSGLRFRLRVAEVAELPELLDRGEADMVVTYEPFVRDGLEVAALGSEVNVLVESTLEHATRDVHLDHGPDDHFTEGFYDRTGGFVPPLKRSYLHDIYGVLDGASAGLGRAVVPLHLLTPTHRLKRVPGSAALTSPVSLCAYRDVCRLGTRRLVWDALLKGVPALLERNASGLTLLEAAS